MKEQDRGDRKIAHSADTGNPLDTVFQAEEVQSGTRIIDLGNESFDISAVDVTKPARVFVPENDLEQTIHSIKPAGLAEQPAASSVSFSLEQLEETVNAKAPSLPSEATIIGPDSTLAQASTPQRLLNFKEHKLQAEEAQKKRFRIEVKDKIEGNPNEPKKEHIVTLSEKPRMTFEFIDLSGKKQTAECVPLVHIQDLKTIIPQGPIGTATVNGKVSIDVVLVFQNGQRSRFKQFPFDIVGPAANIRQKSDKGAA